MTSKSTNSLEVQSCLANIFVFITLQLQNTIKTIENNINSNQNVNTCSNII